MRRRRHQPSRSHDLRHAHTLTHYLAYTYANRGRYWQRRSFRVSWRYNHRAFCSLCVFRYRRQQL